MRVSKNCSLFYRASDNREGTERIKLDNWLYRKEKKGKKKSPTVSHFRNNIIEELIKKD